MKVTPQIGNAFGGYAIALELGERGRAFGAICVRVPEPESGRVWLPTYAMDLGWPHEMSPAVFNVFKRLGVKGARTEGGYNSIGDAHVDWAMANDVTLLLTVGAAATPADQMPLGRGRPWLRDNGEMIEGRPGEGVGYGEPEAEIDGGPVKGDARLVVKDNLVECALPWSVIPHVKALRDAGQPVKFSFRVNHGGVAYELAAGRSVSKQNSLTFHDDWSTHWANEIEFGWER